MPKELTSAPVHIAAICPSAVNVAVPWPSAVPKRLAMEPASDIPEKPDPSKPVMTPTIVNVLPIHIDLKEQFEIKRCLSR